MSVSDRDNRMQFPPTLIDFDNQVGVTGQDHDNYPSPGQQPRYDWLRCTLIALLAHQSSVDRPTQYRIGTIWYNRTDMAFEVYNGTEWVPISESIVLRNDSYDNPTTLQQFYEQVTDKIGNISKRFTFSGVVTTAGGASSIPIPSSIVTELSVNPSIYKPLVYDNGVLIDPRSCELAVGCPNTVNLLYSVKITYGHRFTVIIENFDIFSSDTVTV